MAKRTANSFPLDGLKACIGVLESTYRDGEYDYDMYKTYRMGCIEPVLEELGEKARKNSLEDCLEDLKKILDKLDDSDTVKLDFYNEVENDGK